MLILTVRVDEEVKTGAGVNTRVLGVKGNQVRIGVDAPKDVWVHRDKIFRRCADEARKLVIVKIGTDHCAAKSTAEALTYYRAKTQREPIGAHRWTESENPYPVLLEASLRDGHFPGLLTEEELAHGN